MSDGKMIWWEGSYRKYLEKEIGYCLYDLEHWRDPKGATPEDREMLTQNAINRLPHLIEELVKEVERA